MLFVSATLTIRNLDDAVKQKLRVRAARHQTSMEGEARSILAKAVEEADVPPPPRTVQEMRDRLASVRGTWKKRAAGRSTDEIMKELRGDD
jgi:antitoxin FitA